MRFRTLVAEAVFASLVLGSIAVPNVVLHRAQTSTGSSGESGGTTSSGSSSTGDSGGSTTTEPDGGTAGGSGGSTQEGSGSAGGSGGSGQNGSAGGSGSDTSGSAGGSGSGGGGAGGGTAGGSDREPGQTPRRPDEFGKTIPAVGTVIEATIRNLPPFLLLACLLGLVAGTDPLPPSSIGPDLANDIATLCSRVRVRPLDLGDNPFSSQRTVDPDDVRLTIRVEPGPIIVVEQHLPRRDRNLLTLLAAVLLVLVAVGVGYAVGSRRRGAQA